jgi:translocation and assembly module TamA
VNRALLILLACCVAGAAHAAPSVTVEGVSGDIRDNVLALLSIQGAIREGQTETHVLERLHRRAEDDIRTALQPFGYYTPIIDARFIEVRGEARARYRIELGPRTRIERVGITPSGDGAEDPRVAALIERFPLKSGDPLLHSRYEQGKTQLSAALFGWGYIDARYTRTQLRVNPETARADIVLDIETGQRFRFGEITIEQDELNDELLRRYLPISPGDEFSPRALLDTQFKLGDLGYFSRVDIEPQRDQADGDLVPIIIRTEYLNSQRYSAGLGYGTDTGARLSLSTEFRRINRRGHWVNTDFRLSEIKNSVGANYNIPLGYIPGERLTFSTTYQDEEFEDGDSSKYTVGASISRQPGSWRRRVYLEYSTERFDVGGESRTTDLLIPGVSFQREEVDDPIYVRQGWSFFIDTHGASADVLSSTSFVQARTVIRGAYPLGQRTRLLGRFEYGTSLVESFERLPLSERFYAGGDQSVRGYAYQSIGKRDDEGRVLGGENLATMTAEIERLVWGNVGVAAFMDAGGADSRAFPSLFRGVGAGVRYRAPIGSVQLDLAHPLDGDSRGIRLHLGIRIGL